MKLLSDFKFLDHFHFLVRFCEFFRRTGIFFDHLVRLISPAATLNARRKVDAISWDNELLKGSLRKPLGKLMINPWVHHRDICRYHCRCMTAGRARGSGNNLSLVVRRKYKMSL